MEELAVTLNQSGNVIGADVEKTFTINPKWNLEIISTIQRSERIFQNLEFLSFHQKHRA